MPPFSSYPTGSTPLPGPAGVTSSQDTYPTHYDFMGKGGHRTVLTLADRLNIATDRKSFGMLVTVTNDPNPLNNKTYILCNSQMDSTCNDDVGLDSNFREFSAGGTLPTFTPYKHVFTDISGNLSTGYYTNTVLLQEFAGNTFSEKLVNAGLNAEGVIVDCTGYIDTHTLLQSVVIMNPCQFIFSNIQINFESQNDSDHMFNIKSQGVSIIGNGRSSKYDQMSPNNTKFVMTINPQIQSRGGYHIFSANEFYEDGQNVCLLQGFDCIGVTSIFNRTAAPDYNPIVTTYGVGGICLLEGDPFIGGGGNTINQVQIRDVFIDQTRDHGILLVGGILTQIINCRVSRAGGHGFYIGGIATDTTLTGGGTTSTYLLNCYASSGALAGFCMHSAAYCQLQNCAAENFGMGYFLRSCQNVSLFGCGAEENNATNNLPKHLGIIIPNSSGPYTLNDIGVDNINFFKGSSYWISGGRNIYIPNAYSKDPGGTYEYTNLNGTFNPPVANSSNTSHFTIIGEVRSAYIVNPRITGTAITPYPIAIRRSGSGGVYSYPRDINLMFNPKDDRPTSASQWFAGPGLPGNNYDPYEEYFPILVGTGVPVPAISYVRNTNTNPLNGLLNTNVNAIVLIEDGNVLDTSTTPFRYKSQVEIKNGSTYYTPIVYDYLDSQNTDNIVNQADPANFLVLGLDKETNTIKGLNTTQVSDYIGGGSINLPEGPDFTHIYKAGDSLAIGNLTDVKYIDSFQGETFSEKLYDALENYLPTHPGVIIDCTTQRTAVDMYEIQVEAPSGGGFVIKYPCTIRFGAHKYTFIGFYNALFTIVSDNVTLEGINNWVHPFTSNGLTNPLLVTELCIPVEDNSTAYHIETAPRYTYIGGDVLTTIVDGIPSQAGADYIPRGIENLVVRNLTLRGKRGILVPDNNGLLDQSLSTPGAGGILLTEDYPFLQSHTLIAQGISALTQEPGQSRNGSFNVLEQANKVKNCKIENVTIYGSKQHGIAIIGGSNIEISFCNIAKATVHGIFVGGSYAPLNIANDPDFPAACQMKGGGSVNIKIKNTAVWDSGYYDVYFYNTFNSIIDNLHNTKSSSGFVGIYVALCKNINISNCYISNTASTPDNNVLENTLVRSSLRIPAPLSDGQNTYLYVNDICPLTSHLDEERFYARSGTSYWIITSENVILENCVSKDPGSTIGSDISQARSQFASHFTVIGVCRGIKIINPLLLGNSKVPYCYALRNYPSFDLETYQIPRDVFIDIDPLVEIKKLNATITVVGQEVNVYDYIEPGYNSDEYDLDQLTGLEVRYIVFKPAEQRPAGLANQKTNYEVDAIILHQNGDHIMNTSVDTTLYGIDYGQFTASSFGKGRLLSNLKLSKGNKESSLLKLDAFGIYQPYNILPSYSGASQQGYRFLIREEETQQIKFAGSDILVPRSESSQITVFNNLVYIPGATPQLLGIPAKYGFRYFSPILSNQPELIGNIENEYSALPSWGYSGANFTTSITLITKIIVELDSAQPSTSGWDGTNNLEIEFFHYKEDGTVTLFPIAWADGASAITHLTDITYPLEYTVGLAVKGGEKWAIRFKNAVPFNESPTSAGIKSIVYFFR